MDKNTKKILKFLCKHSSTRYSLTSISKKFSKIPKDYIVEIVHDLYSNSYIKYISDSTIRVTNKGITYISTSQSNWVSEHFIETLALVISFISLVFSIVAIIRTNF